MFFRFFRFLLKYLLICLFASLTIWLKYIKIMLIIFC